MENIQDNIGKNIKHNIEGTNRTKMYDYINCRVRYDIEVFYRSNINTIIELSIEKNISANIKFNIIQKSKADWAIKKQK